MSIEKEQEFLKSMRRRVMFSGVSQVPEKEYGYPGDCYFEVEQKNLPATNSKLFSLIVPAGTFFISGCNKYVLDAILQTIGIQKEGLVFLEAKTVMLKGFYLTHIDNMPKEFGKFYVNEKSVTLSCSILKM